MSALCQKRTHALQQKGLLFDQLVGSRVQDEKEADRSTLRRYSIGGDDCDRMMVVDVAMLHF